jgi:hypothetical protein
MSLHTVINEKCRQCICDPWDVGTAAQKIAACICSECPSNPERLSTSRELQVSLLRAYRVGPVHFDDGYFPDHNLAIYRWSEMNRRVRCWRLSLEEKLEPEGRFLKSVQQGAKAK